MSKNRSLELKEMARRVGLCDQWYNSWLENCSLYDLAEKFISGQDFCILHDFPKIDDIERLFTRSELRSIGVYVDEDDICVESPSTPVLLGDTVMRLEYSGTDVGDIYVRHKSKATIMVSDMSVVSVNVYDNSFVHIVGGSISPVNVYRYGGTITFEGNVIIKERKMK